MSSSSPSRHEDAIAHALRAGDCDLVVKRTLAAYGREIYAFLMGELRDETRADDVFVLFAEALWRSAKNNLIIRASMRAYSFKLARHAMFRYLDLVIRQQRRDVPLSHAGLSAIVEMARTQTREFLRTENRSKLAELRASLDEEERTLLTLRLDQKLSFLEIAEALCRDDESADLQAAAVRLRKRYQLVKDKLRKQAIKAGITSK